MKVKGTRHLTMLTQTCDVWSAQSMRSFVEYQSISWILQSGLTSKLILKSVPFTPGCHGNCLKKRVFVTKDQTYSRIANITSTANYYFNKRRWKKPITKLEQLQLWSNFEESLALVDAIYIHDPKDIPIWNLVAFVPRNNSAESSY